MSFSVRALDTIPITGLGESVLEVGADVSDPSGLIGAVADAAVLDDGRLVVADGLSSRVILYSTDGTVERVLSAEGTGPGEVRRVSRVTVRGDSVSVFDPELQRLTLFSADGEVLELTRFDEVGRGIVSRGMRPPLFSAETRGPSVPPMGTPEGRVSQDAYLKVWRLVPTSAQLLDSLGAGPAAFAMLGPNDVVRASESGAPSGFVLAAAFAEPFSQKLVIGFQGHSVPSRPAP